MHGRSGRSQRTLVWVAALVVLVGLRGTAAVVARARGDERERGDVPGWVLVTIMTAGLVTALWLVADDKLTQLFNDALDSVVGSAP
jgi:hypothetical protein